LEVVDKGAGIAEELRDKVFSPYFTTRRGGTGVGLTVASRVVQAHGGAIRLQSSPDQGSRFELIMPASINDQRTS
jgi:signal transduction histidine kinase